MLPSWAGIVPRARQVATPRSWREPSSVPTNRCSPSGEIQPLPTNGILVAITVMKRTLASRGRLAM